MVAVHQRRNEYIVPQNKLGEDIFIRTFQVSGLPDIIKMPAGDQKALKVLLPKNILDSHLRGRQPNNLRVMVTVIVAEAEVCPYIVLFKFS